MLVNFFIAGSFSYTSRAGCVFIFLFFYLGSFSYTSHVGFTFLWGVSLTRALLTSFLCGEFLLHIPFCRHFYPVSFSYTSCLGFVYLFFYLFFIWGVKKPVPSRTGFFFLLLGEFLLHIPCWVHFYRGCFSYTPVMTSFSFFIWGFYLTYPVLLFFFFFFLVSLSLYLGSFSYTSRAGFIFIWGVSLTHPMLDLLF